MEMENLFYINYSNCVEVSLDALIISMWNKYIDMEGKGGNKIYINNEEFFENSFNNSYDAAYAVSSGDYKWTDEYVYFNSEGYLTSFSHCEDDTCPIDLDRIEIEYLIQSLKRLQALQDKKWDDNISFRAIHDALKDV